MIQREVTVGRAPGSDILYDQNYVHVSNAHAIIYSDGNHLVFKDTSTNGTVINNAHIHHQSVIINYGDSILLAGKYPLTWDRIGIFFPLIKRPTQLNSEYNPNIRSKTVVDADNLSQSITYATPLENRKESSKSDDKAANIEVEIARFNWGAFFLYPLWGFANGMWWAFLISVFFGWTIIPNILFGIMGSKWAWQNKQWRGVDHFVTVQDSWKKWGVGLFLVSIFLTIFTILILVGIASSF